MLKYFLFVVGYLFLVSCSAQSDPKNQREIWFSRLRQLNKQEATIVPTPTFLYQRASLKDSLGDYVGAIQDLNKAIVLDEKYVEAYFLRGAVKEKQEDYSGVINDLNKIIEIDPKNATAYFQRGYIRLKGKDTTGACREFKKAQDLGSKKAEQAFKEFCNK